MSKKRTLVFLLKNNQILLAMKKRGFGQGKWNGVGGKIKDGETLKDGAIRETLEEIGVKVSRNNLKRVGTLDFLFPDFPNDQDMNVTVYVYTSLKWRGEIIESEEMKPAWFEYSSIPYIEMWWDDQFWLPKLLQGSLFKGKFYFKPGFDGQPVGDKFDIKEGSFR